MVPDMLIAMPFSEGDPAHAVIVEKSRQTLSVYRYDGAFSKIADYPCSTGKAVGDKWVSGDMKTPEGVYFFTDHHKDRDLAPVYGSRAFPMNYPNVVDRAQGKDGFAIWLHGTDRPLVPYDSNGCVAMRNADIDALADLIDLEETPILVTDIVRYADVGAMAQERARLTDFTEAWRQRISFGTYHQYLELYHPDYLPPLDWWGDWQTFRRDSADGLGAIGVSLEGLSFYRFQETYVVAFGQRLTIGSHQLPAGRRTLFIREDNGSLRIIGDDHHRIGIALKETQAPLLAAVTQFRRSERAETRVALFVDRWLAAWSSKDIEAYRACYADTFSSKNMSKNQWVKYKASLNRKYARIAVSARDLSYRVTGDAAKVTFTQQYASDRYRSEGQKTLHLRRENGQWKIYREIFSGT